MRKITHVRRARARVGEENPTEYVIPIGNGWIVKNSTSDKFTIITDTKKEAVDIARSRAKAKHIQLVVHGKDGNVEKEESYAI